MKNPESDSSETAVIESIAAYWFARRDMGMSNAERVELDRWLSANVQHARAFATIERVWETVTAPSRHGHARDVASEIARLGAARRRRARP